MNFDLLAGLAVTFTPLAGIGYIMLRKQAGIFRMYIAMLLIGLGYLTLTGGLNDIGARVLGHDSITPTEDAIESAPAAGNKTTQPAAVTPEEQKAAPAPEKPAEQPAPADPDVAPDQGAASEDASPPPAPPPQGASAPAAP
jgi:hypothetical protein